MYRLFFVNFLLFTSVAGAVEPELINGGKLKKHQFKAVQRIEFGTGQHCTGSLIGPKVILFAAHCHETKKGNIFQLPKAVKIKSFIPHPKFNIKVHLPEDFASVYDIKLGILDTEVEEILPLTLGKHQPERGDELLLIGTGAPKPGVRQFGFSKTLQVSEIGMSLQSSKDDGVSSDSGDSGGPVMQIDANGEVGIVGIISTGSRAEGWKRVPPFQTGASRVNDPEAWEFFLQTARDYDLEICGLNIQCEPVKFKTEMSP